MRIAAFAAVMFLLDFPVTAQALHAFGSANCPQTVPCLNSDSSQQLPSSQLASIANSCVTQYFGTRNPDGFFDDIMGLDTNGCLTPKPGAMPKGLGEQLTPVCCVIQQGDNSNMCIFHCDLFAGR